MATWYKAYLGKIEPVEVQKETEQFVIIDGRRSHKDSDWARYRKTREEAKAALIADRQSEVDRIRGVLVEAELKLTAAKNA